MTKQRQEIHCHECERYVQFEIDLDLDGNHVLECPNCGHEHCRVVRKGVITGIRWDSRNGPTIPIYHTGTTMTSIVITTTWTDSATSASWFIANSWAGSGL